MAGCADSAEERRFDVVSTGMTRDYVARMLGVPWQTRMYFEPSGYSVSMKDYKLDSVTKRPENRSDVWYGISSSELAALGLSSGASMAEVEAKLGAPANECSTYYANDRIAFEVCFKDGRVLSKMKIELPPV